MGGGAWTLGNAQRDMGVNTGHKGRCSVLRDAHERVAGENGLPSADQYGQSTRPTEALIRQNKRVFQPGEQVLVLLPISTSKLTAQWQGPTSSSRPWEE